MKIKILMILIKIYINIFKKIDFMIKKVNLQPLSTHKYLRKMKTSNLDLNLNQILNPNSAMDSV